MNVRQPETAFSREIALTSSEEGRFGKTAGCFNILRRDLELARQEQKLPASTRTVALRSPRIGHHKAVPR